MQGDRSTIIIIFVVLIVCIVTLAVVANLTWRYIRDPIVQVVDVVTLSVERRDRNYNFEVPEPESYLR